MDLLESSPPEKMICETVIINSPRAELGEGFFNLEYSLAVGLNIDDFNLVK